MSVWEWTPDQPAPPSLDPERLKAEEENPGHVGNKAAPLSPGEQRGIRRHLVAIADRRLAELDELDKLRELWRRTGAGWDQCGWSALFRNRSTGTVVGLPDHCDRPLCPYCERGRRAARIRDRYRPLHDAALADRRLFLATLTIPNVPIGELREGFARIRKAIERLRRQPWWEELVAGGLWRLELTVNLDERTWHPHANLLFETHRRESMQRTLQPKLQAGWRRALGHAEDEPGDWTWLVQGWDRVLEPIREAVKQQVAWRFDGENAPAGKVDDDTGSSLDYSAKPPGAGWIDSADPAWVIEYVESTAGRRAVGSFGSWRKPPPAKVEHADEALVEAPYVPGDDFFRKRWLPERDPVDGTLAEWELYGRGPRSALRPVKPPGGDPWLVWTAGPDPSAADDDPGPDDPRGTWGRA